MAARTSAALAESRKAGDPVQDPVQHPWAEQVEAQGENRGPPFQLSAQGRPEAQRPLPCDRYLRYNEKGLVLQILMQRVSHKLRGGQLSESSPPTSF